MSERKQHVGNLIWWKFGLMFDTISVPPAHVQREKDVKYSSGAICKLLCLSRIARAGNNFSAALYHINN